MILLPTVLVVAAMVAGLTIVWNLGRPRQRRYRMDRRVALNVAAATLAVIVVWYLLLTLLVGPTAGSSG